MTPIITFAAAACAFVSVHKRAIKREAKKLAISLLLLSIGLCLDWAFGIGNLLLNFTLGIALSYVSESILTIIELRRMRW